jgi:hypothetical protein
MCPVTTYIHTFNGTEERKLYIYFFKLLSTAGDSADFKRMSLSQAVATG